MMLLLNTSCSRLLHRDGFGEVAGLIDITAAADGDPFSGLAHIAGVSGREASRLRPDAQAMRLGADPNACN
jgi:hypothetical protein